MNDFDSYCETHKKRYRDKNGKAISCYELENLLQDRKYCIIKKTFIKEKEISTVWIGITSFGTNFFETMVFNKDNDELDGDIDMERYSSLQDAIDGHERFVKKYMKLEKKE